VRAVEVGALDRDRLGGEAGVEQRADPRGRVHGWEAAQQACQHPVGVDAGMPVEAAEEHRVERARRAQVLRAGEDVVGLVRIRPRHMPEGDRGEPLCQVLGEPRPHAALLPRARRTVRPTARPEAADADPLRRRAP
jgi:hypothetical protein